MSEETVVKQCAPTLAGIKNGSLFSCQCMDEKKLKQEIRMFNKKYASKGLCLLPLEYKNERAMIYMYRPEGVRKDLQNQLAKELLENEGYPFEDSKRCIVKLAEKIRQSKTFPHEIGLFLSYPPEDVKGFIENHADSYKYSGTWKVYGDVETAKKLFQKYKKCTENYCSMLNNGYCFEQLVVAR